MNAPTDNSSKKFQSPAATVGLFLTLTALLYVIGFWLIFRLGSATPLMLSVGVAAVLACLFTNRGLGSLGWSWGSWKYQYLAYLLPLGYVAVAYGFIWVADLGDWYDSEFVFEQKERYKLGAWSDSALLAFHFLLSATVSFVLLLPSVLGEELGWRGLLVPELAKLMPFTGVALTSGFIWAMWHWPLMFMGLYGNDVTPLSYQLFFFTICIMSMSVIMTYIRLRTRSLWPAVIFHMSHNVFLQKFFGPVTSENIQSAWFLDEFGAVLPVTIFLVAIYFFRNGRKEFSTVETYSQ